MPQDESVPYKFKQSWLLATGVGFDAAASLSYSCPHLGFFLLFPLCLYRPVTSAISSVNWLLFLLIRELISLYPIPPYFSFPWGPFWLPCALNASVDVDDSGRDSWNEPPPFYGRSEWTWVCSVCEIQPGEDGDGSWNMREIDFHHHWKHMGNCIQCGSDHMASYP